MKKYIVSREKYTNKAGEEKSSYHRIGEVISFQTERGESNIVKLYANPKEVYYLQEERTEEQKGRGYANQYQQNQKTTNETQVKEEPISDFGDEEIDIQNIPF